ncbi:MAG TPA: hypothetical protein VD884_02550 [Ohtaekwangia sp.]|nr:hypothetical protein [Ohtaekwangia sp.]
MGLDYDLLSVYEAFDNDIGNLDELKKKELLFGKVVSDKLASRGKVKCIKVGSIHKNISKKDLPHLKYNSSDINQLDGSWFYMKDGKYVIFSGIKSELKKIRHLEGIAVYGDNIIRLRLVIELLKKNVKNGLLTLSEQDYKNIAYKVLKTDPTLLKSDESIIEDGVNNWLPTMLLIPLYEDILSENRGRILR